MDKATVIGLILGWASVVACGWLEGSEAKAFIMLPGFILVFGGTFGAAIAGITMKEFAELPKKLKKAFSGGGSDYVATITQLLDFAARARRDGILALEDAVESLKDPFMKKGFQLAIDGTDGDSIAEILDLEVAAVKRWYKEGEDFCKQLGGYGPTLGIIGTVMGLISMLSNLSNAEGMGPAIASAFIATMYGISSANLIYLPLGAKMKNAAERDLLGKRLVMDAVLSIQSGAAPRIVERRLYALIGEEKEEEAGGAAAAQ